ncbi:hypothetical protein [Burkholderia cepacia]|uniref:hypothetical protein n=1 Tax=Burkholderia cepacia TaxID=292 RepID=UPI00115FA70A|nr:hypothetical protein [Burkholderia cepacia]
MHKFFPHLMQRKPFFICVAASAVFLSACGDKESHATGQTTAQATTAPAKAKELTPDIAAAWAHNVNSHKTADGSTVMQVLAYVQAKRPAKFKYRALVGGDDIGYDGVTGEPRAVSITYWIGSRRGEDENYVDIGYDMTPQGQLISPSEKGTPATLALEGGKQSFLKWLDQAYEEDCRDVETRKFTC